MIDLHTHILPGVDDGADDLNESLEIAREAERQGIEIMIATPHYLEEGYQLSPVETAERVEKLQEQISAEKIELTILPGSEAYLTADLARRVDQQLVVTLNDSRYLLVEFPMDHLPNFTENVLYDLKIMGITPIIAHPERYRPVIKDPNLLYNFIQDGVYGQVNASSLLGVFGSTVQKTAELLVKHNLVQVVGSDVHSTNNRVECLQAGMKRIEELTGQAAEFTDNGHNVINDQELVFINPKPYQSKQKSQGRLFSMVRSLFT